MSPRRQEESESPFDASPARKVSMPMATFLAVVCAACGASFWASQIYGDITTLKADSAEIKMRLTRIERSLGIAYVR